MEHDADSGKTKDVCTLKEVYDSPEGVYRALQSIWPRELLLTLCSHNIILIKEFPVRRRWRSTGKGYKGNRKLLMVTFYCWFNVWQCAGTPRAPLWICTTPSGKRSWRVLAAIYLWNKQLESWYLRIALTWMHFPKNVHDVTEKKINRRILANIIVCNNSYVLLNRNKLG